MDYFKHTKSTCNAYRTMQVYIEVQKLKGYAISIYKGLWEDALDKSFFHILENFDWDSGADLSHYATKVVGTILLGKYNHEIEHEVSLLAGMEKKSMETKELDPLNIVIPSEEEEASTSVDRCVHYLLPMFVQDFKFFKSKRPEDRVLTYTGLFNKFSERTVLTAMTLLVEEYGSSMEELLAMKKKSHFRNFPEDRYKNDLDETVEFNCLFKDVIIYKRLTGRASKKFYIIDLKEVLSRLVKTYFIAECVRVIGDVNVYCTLSGNILIGESELASTLERELVGALLARSQSVRVIAYEKGSSLIISSGKELQEGISFSIMEKDFNIPTRQLVSKCINK